MFPTLYRWKAGRESCSVTKRVIDLLIPSLEIAKELDGKGKKSQRLVLRAVEDNDVVFNK